MLYAVTHGISELHQSRKSKNEDIIMDQQGRRNHRWLPGFTKTKFWHICVTVSILLCTVPSVYAIDVKWTPNSNDKKDGDGGGPLPLSNKQRQQLLQLEQAIMNSPDPQATLDQVASTNSMSSTELYNMLQRNHNDMEQSGNMKPGPAQQRGSTLLTAVIWNAITTVVGFMWQIIRHNPKVTTILGVFVLSTIYISTVVVPQTGFILNEHTARNMITNGPTSLFYPPSSYIQQILQDKRNELFCMKQANSIHSDTDVDNGVDSESSSRYLWKLVDFSKCKDDEADDEDDSIATTKTWRPLQTKSKRNRVKVVTTSQHTIDVSDIYKKLLNAVISGRILPGEKETDQNDTDKITIREQIVDWCIYHATNICQTQDITEFAGSTDSNRRRKSAPKMLSNFKESKTQGATRGIMIVPGMGDFHRFGILPLFIDTNANNDNDDDENLYLSLTAVAGAHFDGQIHISIQPEFERSSKTGPILPTKFKVQTSIIIPSKGKALSVNLSQRLTNEIAQSIVQSIKIRVQQSMVRLKQSNSYSQHATKRAQDRRKNRTTLERQMEDMAIDRRRRWQHKNPSGTSNYRPSGDRMRNPNNAISFR